MKINDIKAFIKGCVVANVQVPTLLIGTMGVGKSQIVKQVTDELKIGLVDLRLAQQEAGDLIGLPYKNGDNGTHWAKPEWFPQEGTRGIIFLDELNRAPTDVRQAVFQLVLDRRIHTHKLPDGWFVHAAINPDNGNYQVESLDPAMLRRFCSLVVEPDVDTWLTWAKSDGKIDGQVTEFVNTNRQLLFQPEEIKIDVKPTPDSYRMVDLLLKAKVIMKDWQLDVLRGLIGKEAAIAFIKWMDVNYKKPVSGAEILKAYATVKDKLLKQESAETYQTVLDLASSMNAKKVPLTDLEFKNVAEFVIDSPKESQSAFVAKLSLPMRTKIMTDIRVSKLFLSMVIDK